MSWNGSWFRKERIHEFEKFRKIRKFIIKIEDLLCEESDVRDYHPRRRDQQNEKVAQCVWRQIISISLNCHK